jgi:1-acyl-sn-glycerol-3-phosphate acyltransferase
MLPPIEHEFPRCHRFQRYLGYGVLRVAGWDIEGDVPKGPKAIMIGAPHTSNWDLVISLSTLWALGMQFSWLGKESLFEGPGGAFLKAIGGVPVHREAPQGLVQQVAEAFEGADAMLLLIPPEGTRSRRPYWKSGFYYMSKAAGVPVVLGIADWKRKRSGFRGEMMPTGDLIADMNVVRAAYADQAGLKPENRSDIKLRGEEEGLQPA